MKKLNQIENSSIKKDAAAKSNVAEMVGCSVSLALAISQIEQLAPLNTTILLRGEKGTDMGVIARDICRRSARKDLPMITVNCAALPANRIEHVLFGQSAGAVVGGGHGQTGCFELADGGTLFLDEIGTMPLELQCKLLRVLQDGEFERPGSPRTIKVDVRVIAASNRDLEEEILAGKFREDLFSRLSMFPIIIPPLRQRKEDIPLLVDYFIAKFNKRTGKKIRTVANETLEVLQSYHWPGNVLELESVIERAVITSQGDKLQVLERFDPCFGVELQSIQEVKTLTDLEREHILQVLLKTAWRIEGNRGAAFLLGLNPSTLRARIRKLNIQRP